MKRFLLLALLALLLVGCGDKKVVRYYYNTVTDTLYVCPDTCHVEDDCEDKKDCDKDEEAR